MNEMFHNSQGCNTARVTLRSQGRDIELYYHLSDNPVQHQWQEFHTPCKQLRTQPLSKLSLDEAVVILDNLAMQVGHSINVPVTQEQLNDLHRQFVKHQGTSAVWVDINHYIHIVESLLADQFAEYNAIVYFTTDPEPEYAPIKEEHKLWLTAEEHWGDLLLGYATIGKDWLDLMENNDGFEDLNVQSTISPETRMFFHLEFPHMKHKEQMFHAWAQDKTVPLDNLNKLALGKYYLGKLIITDEFLNFHNVASDWYVPNHSCKLEWNKTVIGQDTVVTNIEFFNSDMFYEYTLKHAGLHNYV